VQVADGYIFVGQSSNDFYIVKTNLSGAELFNLKIPSGDVAGIANCIDTITGGGYIIVVICPSQPSGAADMNIKLVKITEI
jgi:hypothetical protein